MVDTIEIGICPKCGGLTASGKLEIGYSGEHPGEDKIECPACKKISLRYQWDFKDFLVD